MSIDPSKPLDPREAGRWIRTILGRGGGISPPEQSGHFRRRLEERGLAMDDVLRVLRRGQVRLPPEPHIRTGYYTYRVEGRTVDGTSVIVVVTLMSEEHIDLVTVFPDG